MHRRAFIALMGGNILVAPLVIEAQRTGKTHRIAVLGNENNPPWEGFRHGLRDLGYVDGRNVTMEWRWSEGKTDRLPALAMELVALKPDVIVASGTQAVRTGVRLEFGEAGGVVTGRPTRPWLP
jgi:putative tryptophan/tyrosine transport system substrate-binding protein